VSLFDCQKCSPRSFAAVTVTQPVNKLCADAALMSVQRPAIQPAQHMSEPQQNA